MSLVKLHVKKGDSVVVLAGKDKGKLGKIITAMPAAGKVIVEGVNKVKRHSKPSLKTPQGYATLYAKEADIYGLVEQTASAVDRSARRHVGHVQL